MQPPEPPRWAHVPGSTRTADHTRLDVAAATWAGARPTEPRFGAGIDYALQLLQNGFFWEAHEILEPLWQALAPNSRERGALRGIIQLANAGLKLRMERPKAALRLLDDACEAFGQAAGNGLGLETAALLAQIGADRDQLRAGHAVAPQWRLSRMCIKMQITP